MTYTRVFPFFSVVFAVLYIVAVELNWPLLTYHAQLGQWAFGHQPVRQGPAMYWYGWIATAALGSIVASAVATVVPESIAAKAQSWLTWAIPLLAILFFAFLMRGFFMK